MAFLDEVGLAELWNLIKAEDAKSAAGAKVAIGSYKGTGTYGQDNLTSLIFDFVPGILIIHYSTDVCIMTPTMTTNYMGTTGTGWATRSSYNSGTAYSMVITEWGTTVKWYTNTGSSSGSADYQFNSSSYTYDYVAIG